MKVDWPAVVLLVFAVTSILVSAATDNWHFLISTACFLTSTVMRLMQLI